MSALVQDAPRPPVVGTITQFLTALPSPLTVSLVSLAPQIRFVRWTLELVSWKGTWDESWLLLAVWWVLCLGSEAILRCALQPDPAQSTADDTYFLVMMLLL